MCRQAFEPFGTLKSAMNAARDGRLASDKPSIQATEVNTAGEVAACLERRSSKHACA